MIENTYSMRERLRARASLRPYFTENSRKYSGARILRKIRENTVAPVFYERFAKIQWRPPKVAPYTTLRLAPLGIDEGDCWLEGTTQTFRIGSPAEAEL